MNNLDKTYTDLLQDILDNGVEKETRNGGTLSVFGRQIRHDMSEGFPLLTTKKMHWKSIVTELLWFLRGDTNIKYLVDNDCHIWDGDCYQAYVKKHKHAIRTEDNRSEIAIQLLETQLIYTQEYFINKIKTDDDFAKTWGDLGPIYGKQWRSWGKNERIELVDNNRGDYEYEKITTTGIDQIANLINELKTNPDSRRLMVSAWNPADLPHQVLPPCHYGFQVYTRELSISELNILYNKRRGVGEVDTKYTIGTITAKDPNIPRRAISLMYNARSQDFPLGTPFNIASYALLLEILAKMVNMVPDELITNMGDCHIYLNQIDGVREQITREPFELPELVMSNQINFNESVDEFLNSCLITDFIVENYQSHPTIKMPLSN